MEFEDGSGAATRTLLLGRAKGQRNDPSASDSVRLVEARVGTARSSGQLVDARNDGTTSNGDSGF